jgi:ribose 5-phosphate isomerase A
MANEQQKEAVARASLEFVQGGDIVGLGTGSTAAYMVKLLAERVRCGLRIRGIPTSVQTRDLALSVGIPLTSFDEVQQIDVTIDGADEFDPLLNLIKGGGGALLREKIVASASRQVIIIADSSKRVMELGRFPLPVEVVPFAQALVAKKIADLGATVKLREDSCRKAVMTDQGNQILDCAFGLIPDPQALARKLSDMPGVVEHGLFIGLASMVLLASESGIEQLRGRKQSLT